MGNLMTQISGRANVTINKNGILISKDGKEGTDLIDEALKYNGQLPVKLTPDAPQTTPRVPTAPVDSKTRNANSGATPSATATPVPTPAANRP